ncbi:formate dehydrogenase accessory sulfurtransferase FdhD [Aurantimonas sp. VKM B-3413]|uniref:formate dehydrogenase accessory sulfurtransferase FdhD n=1 Tax=Aurantimonas sp. VKM B-3413 TaxID=2779401 RepID=UPI001E4CCB27|nr:formate dehydrogenase accessory sulfurtransferase FdhD [Aurantimonas sp. VKM B-3413]MCB8837294.1 formate dehydrogenase accessory sulfurtransferase FdhD [Aurantimonas sp. VKM B-3413]
MTTERKPTSDVPAAGAATIAYRGGVFQSGTRNVPEEVAVAISINGSTHAVMMATPSDISDLGRGLALTERIVSDPSEIERIEIEQTSLGIDCRLWLVEAKASTYTARRRQMTGPVGCGLCGVESLELAGRNLPAVAGETLLLTPTELTAAIRAMAVEQELSRQTRAVHAAAFHRPSQGLVVTREDVGRHNALDKVFGHLAERGVDPASGFLTITSRVSVELIQKAAVMGCPLIAAVSAPTALAIQEAESTNITLVAVVRGDEFEIFTHPQRIAGALSAAGGGSPADHHAGEGVRHGT